MSDEPHDVDPTVVMLSGELDIATIAPVRDAVEKLIADGHDHITFDVTEVTFLDSSALALLAQTARLGIRVAVRQPSPILRRMIEATGMASVVVLEP
jgi:anti-anti-sigma factor